MAISINLSLKTRDAYYPDIPLFLVSIPLIAAFNYYLMHPEAAFNSFLLLNYGIDTLQGYAAVLGMRYMTLWLDEKYPYEHNLGKRLMLQLAGATLLGLVIITLLTELTSLIIEGHSKPSEFYAFNLWIVAIWALMVNTVYIILHFYKAWQSTVTDKQPADSPNDHGVMARKGNRQMRIPYQEIIGFSVDGNYAVCHHLEGDKYYLDQSLAEVETHAPPSLFFRLNRQFILNQSYVLGYNRAQNGKVIALLKEQQAFPKEISISRTKAPEFKRWLQSA